MACSAGLAFPERGSPSHAEKAVLLALSEEQAVYTRPRKVSCRITGQVTLCQVLGARREVRAVPAPRARGRAEENDMYTGNYNTPVY